MKLTLELRSGEPRVSHRPDESIACLRGGEIYLWRNVIIPPPIQMQHDTRRFRFIHDPIVIVAKDLPDGQE